MRNLVNVREGPCPSIRIPLTNIVLPTNVYKLCLQILSSTSSSLSLLLQRESYKSFLYAHALPVPFVQHARICSLCTFNDRSVSVNQSRWRTSVDNRLSTLSYVFFSRLSVDATAAHSWLERTVDSEIYEDL